MYSNNTLIFCLATQTEMFIGIEVADAVLHINCFSFFKVFIFKPITLNENYNIIAFTDSANTG